MEIKAEGRAHMERGQVHVYTGDGKGKTTAAAGLALRALGGGMRVFIGQFIKEKPSGEMEALRRFDDMAEVRRFGKGFVRAGRGEPDKPDEEHAAAAKAGFQEARRAVLSGRFGMVVLDEINTAVSLGLLGVDDVLELIREKPDSVELVLTGRGAHEKVVEAADLVTEMREIKHYFKKGLMARKGIEY
jgi:cob(I)alamin adenosyltransferase